MPDFTAETQEAHVIRVQVLSELLAIASRSTFNTTDEFNDFTVTRTNERKGYRDERDYANNSPYQGDPKTLIRIEIELEDDTTPNFQAVVDNVIAYEKASKEAAARAKIAALELTLRQVQQELDLAKTAQKEL